jgi:hypothetical protein
VQTAFWVAPGITPNVLYAQVEPWSVTTYASGAQPTVDLGSFTPGGAIAASQGFGNPEAATVYVIHQSGQLAIGSVEVRCTGAGTQTRLGWLVLGCAMRRDVTDIRSRQPDRGVHDRSK